MPVRNCDAALPEAGDQQEEQRNLGDHEGGDDTLWRNEPHPDPESCDQKNGGYDRGDYVRAKEPSEVAERVLEG